MPEEPPSRDCHVRRASADDAELVASLNEHVQAVHAELLPGLFKPAGRSTLSAADAQALLSKPETIAVIAVVDGQPAGYAYAEVRRRPESPYVYAYDEIYLHHLSVVPTHRRRGVGTALLNAVGEAGTAVGIARLALDVWSVNEPARAFFKAQGFAPYNERLARGGWKPTRSSHKA